MSDLRSTPFSLRQALPDDHMTVVALIEQFCQHFAYPFNSSARSGAVGEMLITAYLGAIWLIETNGHIIGYLALTYGFTFEWGGRDAFVDEFYIIEAYRNRGLGKQVLADIQQKAQGLGLCALHLQTEIYNDRARKLYEAADFIDLRQNTLTWQVPDGQHYAN